ncbi:MAG: N-acetyltransferase [Hymenobacter sp.]|jgi:GNAT superfamily N-acetyltransferase|nr:N-acetyltransferase [Hymenobacter sp.]
MLIREAQVADIPAYMEVRFAVRENPLNTPGLVTYADNMDYLTRRGKGWVAEVDHHIVGFAIADLQDHSIWALFVHPEYNQRGIGRALHDIMLAWYISQTNETVWLCTAPGTRAEAFYRKAGWRDLGLRPGGEVKFELTLAEWQRHAGA